MNYFCTEGIRQKELHAGCKRPDSEVSNRNLSDTAGAEGAVALADLGLLKRVWAALLRGISGGAVGTSPEEAAG